MIKIISKLKKYLSLYGYFIKNCLIAQMEYRANFIISVFIEIAFIFVKILYIIVVFNTGSDINGLSPYQILMFIGSYTFITGIMDAVYFPNVSKIPDYIRNGDLDIFITKPVSLQFLVSFRYFDFGLAIPNVIAGVIMIFVGWVNLGLVTSVSSISGYVFFTLIGIILSYPILYIPATLSFWIVKTSAIFDIIWAMWDFNNMPMGIYSKWIQRMGVFVFPIFIITNFAPMFAMSQLSTTYMWWSVVVTVLFLYILNRFWRFAIKNYTSASS